VKMPKISKITVKKILKKLFRAYWMASALSCFNWVIIFSFYELKKYQVCGKVDTAIWVIITIDSIAVGTLLVYTYQKEYGKK